MIWGSQYDAMMNWMAKNNKAVGSSDSSKRNTEAVTGKKAEDVINNVYDLYGCNYEWTLEAGNTIGRVYRGGGSGDNTSPAGRSYSEPDSLFFALSFHATLYIK